MQNGLLRVWFQPSVGSNTSLFYMDADSVKDAVDKVRLIQGYENFITQNNKKLRNAKAGLEILMDGEWEDWMNDNGDDFNDILNSL